jgi:predicted dehydrogenase
MRIGLIGAGFIGRMHMQVAKAVPGIEIAGYFDPHVRANHPDLAGRRAFSSLDEMVKAGLDGVIVAVPDELHVPIATDCIKRGWAVLLEKPAAPSLAECKVLARAVKDARGRLLVGHQRRHHAASRITKDLIRQGRLGKLLAVSGVFALKKDAKYFVERPRSVGLTNLIHDLDLLQHFCGRITSVSAAVSHAGRGAREIDTMALTMEFEDGAIGNLIGTDSAPSPWGWDQATTELPSIPYNEVATAYCLLGTTASLAVPDLRLYSHRPGEAWHQSVVEEKLPVPEENAYANQLKHFTEVVKGARPLVGVDEALATQAALEAITLSASEGRRIDTRELVTIISL